MWPPAAIVTMYVGAAAVCVWIAIQDFRERSVSAWLFLLLAALGIARMVSVQIMLMVYYGLINLVIIAVMVGVLVVWQWIRGRLKRGQELGLGAGDIAMFAAMGCWVHPVAFLLFTVVSLWVVLLATLIWRRIKRLDDQWPVPLAGGQALLFIPLQAASVGLFLFHPRWDDYQALTFDFFLLGW